MKYITQFELFQNLYDLLFHLISFEKNLNQKKMYKLNSFLFKEEEMWVRIVELFTGVIR